MFIASKIILKSALLAAGAATPFIAATPTGTGSTQPAYSPAAGVQSAPVSQTLPNTLTAPTSQTLPYTLIAPGLQTPPDPLTAPNAPGLPKAMAMPSAPGLPKTLAMPSAPGLPKTLAMPNAPYITIAPLTQTPKMTNIPKSYVIYLLHRSDGVLIGPNGVVPLKPSVPKNILVQPAKKP
jgi:hypothetical protein